MIFEWKNDFERLIMGQINVSRIIRSRDRLPAIYFSAGIFAGIIKDANQSCVLMPNL
jgi:hypothetical protein